MIAYTRRALRHAKDEGASAVEYGLLVAAIAAVIVVVVFALGGIIRGKFSSTCSTIGNAAVTANATDLNNCK
jgi:pilus assembly protein Flp/PilA